MLSGVTLAKFRLKGAVLRRYPLPWRLGCPVIPDNGAVCAVGVYRREGRQTTWSRQPWAHAARLCRAVQSPAAQIRLKEPNPYADDEAVV